MFNYFKKKRILKHLTVPHYDYGVLTICLLKKTDLTAKTDEVKQVKKELKEIIKLTRKYTNYKTIPKMVLNTITECEDVTIPPPRKVKDLVFREHPWRVCLMSQRFLVCVPKEDTIYYSDYQSDLVTVELVDESEYMEYENVFCRAEIPVDLPGEKLACDCTAGYSGDDEEYSDPSPTMYLESGSYSIVCSCCQEDFREPTKKEITKTRKQLLQQLVK